MNVQGVPISPKQIEVYLLESMQLGTVYKRSELVEMAKTRHLSLGGVMAKANPTQQTKKALDTLKKNRKIENVSIGCYRLPEEAPRLESAENFNKKPENSHSKPVHTVENAYSNSLPAEIEMESGSECVYAWYLPAYRRIAEIEGCDKWPMKIGRTDGDPHERMNSSVGQSPEKPVLAFVLRIDNSSAWEKFIHSSLEIGRQRINDAVGNEWFNTNLEQLRSIAVLRLNSSAHQI